MNPSEGPIRRWRFYAEGAEDDNQAYLGRDGQEIDGEDIDGEDTFQGTSSEAYREADRRSDLWEERTGSLCLRVTYESLGKVQPERTNGGSTVR